MAATNEYLVFVSRPIGFVCTYVTVISADRLGLSL